MSAAREHPDASLHWDFDRRIERLLPRKVAAQRRDELGLNQEHVDFAHIVRPCESRGRDGGIINGWAP